MSHAMRIITGSFTVLAIVLLGGWAADSATEAVPPDIQETAAMVAPDAAAKEYLACAMEAVARGDTAAATHYVRLCFDQAQTPEFVCELLHRSTDAMIGLGTSSEPVECAELIVRHLKLLSGIKVADAEHGWLTPEERETLLAALATTTAAARRQFDRHHSDAWGLYRRSKGFLNDDEDLQKASLHELNISQLYILFLNEGRRTSWAEHAQVLRSELSTADFQQQITKDQHTLGIVLIAGGAR